MENGNGEWVLPIPFLQNTLMNRYYILLFVVALCCGENKTNPIDARSALLLESLEKSFVEQDWYVPLSKAIEGLKEEQAFWKDSSSNHSIAELVSHVNFWNDRILTAFSGLESKEFDDDNEKTFHQCDDDWQACISKNNDIYVGWKRAMENATSEQLDEWGAQITEISSHNAYHTGQIIYILKMNGWW